MSQKCQQCLDYEFKQRTGSWPNGQSFNRWAMWGCCCDPATLEDKVFTLDIYTR